MFFQLKYLLFLLSSVVVTETMAGDSHLLMDNNKIFPFKYLGECKRNEYYDLDYFKCVACNTVNKHLEPSNDRFSCICSANAITLAIYDAHLRQPICMDICRHLSDHSIKKELNLPKVSVTNKNITTNCRRPSTYPRISCKLKFINYTTTNGDKNSNSGPPTKRIRIFQPNTNNNTNLGQQNCNECDLKYNYHYQDYCIANALIKGYLNYNAFWQLSGSSGHFGDLKFVAFFCQSLRNVTACNYLANLCVLSHYAFDRNSPCSVFLLAQTSDAIIKYAGMDEDFKDIRPFLFFKKGKETAEDLSQAIESIPYDTNNRLELFATVFSLDGQLLRWENFKASHVNLCQMNSQSPQDILPIKFARKNTDISCRLTLENIIDLAEIYADKQFINVFLNYTKDDKYGEFMLQPVPILIEDLTSDNEHDRCEDWQLVKRFQMLEAQRRHHFGLSYPLKYEDSFKLQKFKSIRYVEKFEIIYTIKDNNRITIPIIKLRYQTVEIHTNGSLNDMYNFKMAVNFRKDGEVRSPFYNIILPAVLAAALFCTILQTYNFKNRHPNPEFCDSGCVVQFILLLISSVANAFVLVFILHITCLSIEYLTQQTVTITLPIEKDQNSMEILVYTALVLKAFFLAIHFWRIGHCDIFFIDWERPKGYENNHFNMKSNLETSSVCSSARTFMSDNNVSAWRIFFVANEWIQLSAKQKTSIFIQGFLVIILYNLFEKVYIWQNDITLKLFVIIVIYVGTYIGQITLRELILNRIFGSPLQKFIDICSIANISVFTLLEKAYGFYIHGRSPHGFADTDMSSMILQLQRESQNMCSKRGLLTDSDHQTYVILPPINLRIYFDKLLTPFQKSCNISQVHFQKELSTLEGSLEKTYIAYGSVNRFFCAFIDHAIKDMDYIIKEKTFLEKIFCCEFDNYLTENKGTFYIDNSYSFSRLLLYGNELQIFILELSLLLTIYLLTVNFTASVVAICLLNKLFRSVFRSWTRQNVANKTLIDKRFLM